MKSGEYLEIVTEEKYLQHIASMGRVVNYNLMVVGSEPYNRVSPIYEDDNS
jgi:hypothetical protein